MATISFSFLIFLPLFMSMTASRAGEGSEAHPVVAALPLKLEHPTSLAVDREGRLFIVASQQHQVFELDSPGHLRLVAGTGLPGGSGDHGPATQAELHYPSTVSVDSGGNLFVAEPLDHRIRRVSLSTGTITTIVGALQANQHVGEWKDPGEIPGNPDGVSVEGNGNLIVVDRFTCRVYRIDSSGMSTILAGNGTRGFTGDGGQATKASLDPNAAIVEKTGDILIADSGNQRIRRVVAATGTIMTIAGTGTPGFDADGVPAHQAKLSNPVAIALGPSGDLFIADSTNHRIRRVDLNSGVISTAVGTGTPGFAGDGGAATQAQLATPTGVAIDTDGNLYIADHDNQRVRRVDAKTGLITSIAGKGIPAAAERAVP